MKAIRASIFKDRSGDCSNGGISSKFDEILIPCETGWIDVDETNPPENLCKIVTRDLGFIVYKYCEPYAAVDKGNVGWMFGGTLIYSSDSRFESDYPLRLNDRQETYEMYEELSK